MKPIFLLFLLSIALFAVSCSKSITYTPDNLPEKQLHWGNGGGFVGKETIHLLCDNGQLFSRDKMSGQTTADGKTGKKKAKALFAEAEKLGLDKLSFNHPGNIYNFIEWRNGGESNRIVWGDKNAALPKPVSDYFGKLNALLKK